MYSRNQGCAINTSNADFGTNPNVQAAAFMWLHRSIQDIQACLDVQGQAKGSTSATLGTINSSKTYLYDVVSSHTWRNNSNAECHLQFYKLSVRRDIPAYTLSATAPQLSPPATYNYQDCARINPTGWTAPLADLTPVAASGFGGTDVNYTPYMNPILTSCFKIKKVSVMGPKGKSSVQVLRPGETASLTTKASKPMMCSFNKFFLTSTQSNKVGEIWEALKETPLLLMIIRGTPAHDSANPVLPPTNATPAPVVIGKAWVDYNVKAHARFVYNRLGGAQMYHPFGAAAAITGNLEQVPEVTANVATEQDI